MRFSLLALLLIVPCSVSADIQYSDVPEDAWYRDAVSFFLEEKYLDSSQSLFRPADRSSRAEFAKLITELNGGILDETPSRPSFNDVSPADWFHSYIEEAAREEWIRGDDNCFGRRPCFVRPHDPVTRAEAAVLMRRAFGKRRLSSADRFQDNPEGTWFSDAIQIAADHCILRGDDETGLVRPQDFLNRAEMVTMLSRVDQGKVFPNC